MKKQKCMNVKDITIWYPLKCNGKYYPIKYSFNGIVTSFSDARDAFNFINNSFLTKRECIGRCRKLNAIEIIVSKE